MHKTLSLCAARPRWPPCSAPVAFHCRRREILFVSATSQGVGRLCRREHRRRSLREARQPTRMPPTTQNFTMWESVFSLVQLKVMT